MNGDIRNFNSISSKSGEESDVSGNLQEEVSGSQCIGPVRIDVQDWGHGGSLPPIFHRAVEISFGHSARLAPKLAQIQ